MAYVTIWTNRPLAGYTLDTTTADLYGAVSLADTVTFDRYGGQIQGHPYPEVLRFGMSSYDIYGVRGEIAFGGDVDYILDYSSPFNYSITGGYVSHYFESVSQLGSSNYFVAQIDVRGGMVDALEVGAAINSPSSSDDLKVIKKMLSGNDQFDITYDGNKKVYGYEGDDTFKVNSNKGTDIIDGGSGSDTIEYDFNLHDQSFSYTNNQLIINHSGGKKTLKNFETFSFNDGIFTSDQLKLGKITKIYDQPSSTNSFGIYKTKSNAYVVVNNLRQQTVGDYGDVDGMNILWTKNGQSYHKFTSDPVTAVKGSGERNFTIDVYRGSGNSWIQDTFKDIDQNGKYRYEKTQKLSLSNLLGLEDQIANDLNNDGVIGDRIVDVLSNGSGSKGFYKLSSESYIIDNNGLNVGSSPQNQIIPHNNGNPFSFKYTPTGATSYDSVENNAMQPVIDVYAQSSSRYNLWKYDTFNANSGAWLNSSSSSLIHSELLGIENIYNTDLDGDGNIGDRITEIKSEHSSSSKSLYKTETGALVVDSNGHNPGNFTNAPTVLIKYGKSYNSLYKTNSNELGFVSKEYQVESPDGSYQVSDQFIYYGSGNSWTKDSFTTGVYTGTKKLNLTELLAEESQYNTDLNKDGNIGDTISKVISNNGSKGLYKIASGAYVIDNPGLNSGDSAQNPIIPKSNGKSHVFKNEPTGILNLAYENSETGVREYESQIYSGSGNSWKVDTFKLEDGELIASENTYLDYVLQDEVVSQKDLTGDGNFGDKVLKVLSKHNPSGIGLYKAESGALVLGSNNNNEGDFFQNNARFVLSKESKGIKTPFKLSTDDVSYSSSLQSPSELGSIYWGSNNNWNREIFDKSGVHIETRKLNYSQLLIDEVRYETDLSGDEVINNDSIEKIYSSYSTNTPYNNVAGLYKTKSGAIVFDQNNLNINDSLQRPTSSLTKDGKLHSFSVDPSIAMKLDPNGSGQQNEYSAFLKNGGKWSREVFNSSGELINTINYNFEPIY